MSGRSSLLRSPSTTPVVPLLRVPLAYVVAVAGNVLLLVASSTPTVPELLLTTTRSGRLSAFRSRTATLLVPSPPLAYAAAGANVTCAAAGAAKLASPNRRVPRRRKARGNAGAKSNGCGMDMKKKNV